MSGYGTGGAAASQAPGVPRLEGYLSATGGYPDTFGGKPVVRPGTSTAAGSQFFWARCCTIQNATVLDSISRASRSECLRRIMNWSIAAAGVTPGSPGNEGRPGR